MLFSFAGVLLTAHHVAAGHEPINTYSPDPISNEALVEIANYYYNTDQYDKAIEFYAKAPSSGMTKEQRTEVKFKTGYAHFVQKRFAQAKTSFKEIASIEGEYYEPANYYLGMCQFFEGNYNEAIKRFRILEKRNKYKAQIPYYIAQIYSHQKKYDQVIAFGAAKAKDTNIKNRPELNQLVGGLL